jgi:transcriptional regulator with XRE-family HTH domain
MVPHCADPVAEVKPSWRMAMSPKNPDEIDVLVGRNIRIHRVAKRLSQTELAERIGVTFQQVQKYEKGVNRIGSGRLVRIADILEVPVMTLLDGAQRTGQAPARSPLTLIADREPFRLVQAFSQIKDKRLRRALVDLVGHIIGGPSQRRRGG